MYRRIPQSPVSPARGPHEGNCKAPTWQTFVYGLVVSSEERQVSEDEEVGVSTEAKENEGGIRSHVSPAVLF